MAPSSSMQQAITFTAEPTDLTISNKTDNYYREISERLEKLEEIKSPTMYVFLREDLRFNSGLAAAQVAHAVSGLANDLANRPNAPATIDFKAIEEKALPKTVIVLGVEDKDELYKLSDYLDSQDIENFIYVDEGGKEKGYKFEPTCLATQYISRQGVHAHLLSGLYNLYSSAPSAEEITRDSFIRELRQLVDHPKYLRKANNDREIANAVREYFSFQTE